MTIDISSNPCGIRAVLAVASAVAVAMGGCSKSAATQGDAAMKTDDFAEVQAAAPAATVQATALTAAYSDNALDAESKFSGKVIEVSGWFMLNQKASSDGGADAWYAVLSGGETTGSMHISMFVQCYFDASSQASKQRFSALRNGDMIHVKGKASQSRAFQVDLRGCMLL